MASNPVKVKSSDPKLYPTRIGTNDFNTMRQQTKDSTPMGRNFIANVGKKKFDDIGTGGLRIRTTSPTSYNPGNNQVRRNPCDTSMRNK